jgi:hypothetical protein
VGSADQRIRRLLLHDPEGFDLLSFTAGGEQRVIEVKPTTYGDHTPFLINRREMEVSKRRASARGSR